MKNKHKREYWFCALNTDYQPVNTIYCKFIIITIQIFSCFTNSEISDTHRVFLHPTSNFFYIYILFVKLYLGIHFITMKKLLSFLTLLLITNAIPLIAQDFLPIFGKINHDVLKNGRAYETLRDATATIGHRLTGSENGRKAEEYAFNLLKSYGYDNVRYQAFNVEAWTRETVTVKIGAGNDFKSYPVVALAHSPVSAHVSGEIIDLGDGLEEDFLAASDKIKDKIVLANINIQSPDNKGKRNLHRSEKTALAIKYGARGIILANGVKGGVLLTGTASVTGHLITIPAACVSLESGQEIRKSLAETSMLEAQIDMTNLSRPIHARNIIATLPGISRELSKEIIIIGGHLDSWDLATGAVDNGVGSFSIIDMARVFKQLKLKTARTIRFVLFMGEEQGLLGSKHMVSELKRSGEIKDVRLMINLDMNNNTRGFNAGGSTALMPALEQIGNEIKQVDTSYANEIKNSTGLHSDHQPFMLSGIPTATSVGSLPPGAWGCYHADCDHFNLIIKEQLDNNVRYVSMVLYALANIPHLPVATMSDTETRDFLIKNNLKTELILGKEWRWDE